MFNFITMPFDKHFIPGKKVELPAVAGKLKDQLAPLIDKSGHVIDYTHHSVVLNKKRKFAFYAASNIDGTSWKAVKRTGNFVKDERSVLPEYQLGNELYNAIRAKGNKPNDFEEGHLTSYQEVLWGQAPEKKQAANDTFYFTNCVPQHERLNSGLWRSLEQYVLKTETVAHGMRVSVITGPLLSDKDPWFIEKINGEYIQIPCSFWKVIYYPNGNGLNAAGFMMSHKQLLLQEGTVTYDKGGVKAAENLAVDEGLFMDYKYDSVYQVKVEFIQQETGLKFMLDNVKLPYTKNEKNDVLFKRIEVMRNETGMTEGILGQGLDYSLEGITL